MANLKEIRVRISSVKSTRQITSAMKMVSAAKLRRAQDVIIQMRPYALKLHEILTSLTESLESDPDNIYGKVRPLRRALIIAISSNKGLCGAFNLNVVKTTIQLADENYKELKAQGNLDIITVGKKGYELLKAKKYPIAENQSGLLENLSFTTVNEFCARIMLEYLEGKYDEIRLVYNQFKNAAVQELTTEQFLPIAIPAPEEKENEPKTHYNFIFEPSQQQIVKELIPKSLKMQFYKAFLDSVASEHGARMTAMHKATDNATELIKQLQLDYNKARQAAITKEILEIVGGAEALKA